MEPLNNACNDDIISCMKSVLDLRKEYEQKEFLQLSPLDRMRTMHAVMSEIIAIKAKVEGYVLVSIYKFKVEFSHG